jgi:hypothetical protein
MSLWTTEAATWRCSRFPDERIRRRLRASPIAPPPVWAGGSICLALMTDRKRLVGSLSKGWHLATSDDVEAWRIASALPRLGIDVLADEIPLGVGLEAAIDFG